MSGIDDQRPKGASKATSIAASETYTVDKLQLFFEYLTPADVIVTRAGFIRKESESEAIWYIDGVRESNEKVYLHAPDTHRGKKTALCDHFLPDRSFNLPNALDRVHDDSVEWRHQFGFVRQVFTSNTLQRAIAVRVEPEPDFCRTRVRLFWRLWVNRNPLDVKFAQWFVNNTDKEHRRQVRAVARQCKDESGDSVDSNITLAIPRRIDRAAEANQTENVDDDDFKTDHLAKVDGHRTWLADLSEQYWQGQIVEYYLFTFQACVFRKVARRSKNESVKTATVACSRGLPQTGATAEFRLERHLHNGHKQFLLCKFMSNVVKHLERCILIDAAIAPTFAPSPETWWQDSGANYLLDEQQRQCVQFLHWRQTAALRSDGFASVRRLRSIQIADSGWRYLCDDNRLEHDMSPTATTNSTAATTSVSKDRKISSAVSYEHQNKRREQSAACLLCVRSQSSDPKSLYDIPSQNCGLDWLEWQEERVRSAVDRLTFVGGSFGAGKHVSVLYHLLVDCEQRRGAFHASMLAKRSVEDECDYRYLSNRFKTHGLSLQTLCQMMAEQGNDECNVPTGDAKQWSNISSTATLVVCNEYDVWRWLMAISTLNDREAVYVGQSLARKNVFHITRPSADDRIGETSSGAVRMRVHVIRTLDEYQSFTFASLLTSDVVVVTVQLLAQLVPENCSYLSGFRFDEAVATFEPDEWMECVRHQMNCTQNVSLARLCARNDAANNVPLEAIFWRCIVYDSPERCAQHGRAHECTAIERKLALTAFDNFSRVVKAAHVVCIDSVAVPNIVDCRSVWRALLTAGENVLTKDFLLRCSRRFVACAQRSQRLARRDQQTIYIEPSKSHLAFLQTVFDLECQLQDLQALVYDKTVHVDGAFQTMFANRYPQTLCHRIEHLKASFRYALHACEQNWRIAPIAMRNLSRQILQRSARFLSQNNVEYTLADQDPQIAAVGGSERTDAAFASDAFHSMVRYRQRQASRNASQECQTAAATDADSDGSYSTESESQDSADDTDNETSENSSTGGEEEDSNQFDGYEDEDDEDDEDDDGEYESDVEWMQGDSDVPLNEQERLMLGSLVVNYGGGLVSGRNASRLWDANIELRMATAVDNDSDRYEFVNDSPSLYASVQGSANRAYLDEFDSETGIGWSRCLDRRVLLQRSETLPDSSEDESDSDGGGGNKANEDDKDRPGDKSGRLPYQICFTSVADRQLVSFINLLANSKRLRRLGEPSDCAQSVVDDNAVALPSPHSLCDYERYYAMLEPATLLELTEDGESVAAPELDLSAAELNRDAAASLASRPGAISSSLDDVKTRADANEVLQRAKQCLVGEELVAAWRDAAERIEKNRACLEQHYIATRAALRDERLASGRLLCNQIRLLIEELMSHPQQPLVAEDLQAHPLVEQFCSRGSSMHRMRGNESEFSVAQNVQFGDGLLSLQNDERASETIEAMYSFYAETIRSLLSVEAMGKYQPLLSPNLAYCCEQVSKLRRNTRWLNTDLEFVEQQLDRLDQSRSSVQQTLGRIEDLSRDKSAEKMALDDRSDCAICLDSSVGKDIALYPCGHWCCWSCYKSGGKKKHRVEQDEDSYIGAALSGRRCAFCRYILQRFESIQRVRQSEPNQIAQCSKDNQEPRLEEMQNDDVKDENRDKQTLEANSMTDFVENNTKDDGQPPEAKKARVDSMPTGDSPNGLSGSAFVKCESILAWIKRQIAENGEKGLRCAVFSQYAVQLRELHTMLCEWIASKKVSNVCLLYCPTAEQAIERQSSDYVEQMANGQCRTSSGTAATGKRKRFSESDLEPPLLESRHIIVLQHLDVTRNLARGEHGLMHRIVPPIHALSHVLFCESLCVRLQKGGEMVQRMLQLEEHLLAQVNDDVEVVRFVATGGVDEYLHDAANRLDSKQRGQRGNSPQYMSDVTDILNVKSNK